MTDVPTLDISGQVAVITGGAGVIGSATAAGMAAHGAQVVVVDVNGGRAADVSEQINAAFPGHATALECDVSCPESVNEMAETVEREIGPVSILHNNAATKGSDASSFFEPPETYDLSVWRSIMAVNIDGMFLVTRTIGTKMAERKRGSIIHTASIYGATMGPDQRIYQGEEFMDAAMTTPPSYSVSKAGVTGLTLYFATYWGARGVRVNTVTPGGVRQAHSDEFVARYSDRVPMQRMATVNDIVGPVLFLASDAASYVTGQNLHVDGGLSAW